MAAGPQTPHAGYTYTLDVIEYPTGKRDVRLIAQTFDGSFTAVLMMASQSARALAQALLEQAREADSVIRMPGHDSTNIPRA